MNAKKDLIDKKLILSQNLKTLRLNRGFTQNDIAGVLGLNRSTYTYYEMGKTLPDILVLHKLARFYDISLDALFQSISKLHESRMRPKKIVIEEVSEICGLSKDERSIVAILRSKGHSYTHEMLSVLKDKKQSLQDGM